MIGLALREERLKRRFTQRQMAKYLDCSQPSVAQWETDRNSPSLYHFMSICVKLNVSPNKLLGYKK